MKIRGRCKFLCSASAIIFLLGVVSGIGGVIDLINNTDILIEINSSTVTLVLLTLAYIMLSAATFITAISLYEQNKKFIIGGITLSAIFVINSLAEGHILFNETVGNGAIINIIAAIIIISLLILSKRAIRKTKETKTIITLNHHPEQSLSH